MSILYRLRSRVLWLRGEAKRERQWVANLRRTNATAELVAEHAARLAHFEAKLAEAETRLAEHATSPHKGSS